MVTKDMLLDIVGSLQPNFAEYNDNSKFHYWMDYACELDDLQLAVFEGSIVTKLNTQLGKLAAGTAQHHACTDVASTLEETYGEQFAGKFKY